MTLFNANPNQNPIPIPIGGGTSGSAGAGNFNVVTTVGPYAAAYSDLVEGNALVGNVAVSLPAASAATNENIIAIKNIGVTPNFVLITPNGGDTIDGAAGVLSVDPGQIAYLVSDGVSDWVSTAMLQNATGVVPATYSSANVTIGADGRITQASNGGVGYNVTAYGAKGDAIQGTDGAMAAGSATFTSALSTFTPADVGKLMRVQDAGVAAPQSLQTTIAAFVNANTVTLAAPNASGLNLAGRLFCYGTDDAPAFQAAATALLAGGGGNGALYIPIPTTGFLLASPITIIGTGSIRVVGESSKIVVGLDAVGSVLLQTGNQHLVEISGLDFYSDINVIGSGSYPLRVLSLGGNTISVHHCTFADTFGVDAIVALGGITNSLVDCAVFGGNVAVADKGIISLFTSGGTVERVTFIDGNVNGATAWIACLPTVNPSFHAAGSHPFTIRNCSFDEVGGSHHVFVKPAAGIRASRVDIIDCDGLGNPGGAGYLINDTDDVYLENCGELARAVTPIIQLFGCTRTTIYRLQSQSESADPTPNSGDVIIMADAACGAVEVIDSVYNTLSSEATTTAVELSGIKSIMVPAAALEANVFVKADAANPGQFIIATTVDAPADVAGVALAGTSFASTSLTIPAAAGIPSPSYYYILTANNGQNGILTEWANGGPFLGPPWIPVNFAGAVTGTDVAVIAAGVIAAQNNPGVFDVTASNVGAVLTVSATVEGVGYDRETNSFVPSPPIRFGQSHAQIGLVVGQTYQIKIDGANAITAGDRLTLSAVSNGRAAFTAGATFLGVAMSNSAATADNLVSFVYGPRG